MLGKREKRWRLVWEFDKLGRERKGALGARLDTVTEVLSFVLIIIL